MARWSDPQPSPVNQSPYTHWWSEAGERARSERLALKIFNGGSSGAAANAYQSTGVAETEGGVTPKQAVSNGILDQLYQGETPIPPHASNGDGHVSLWDVGQIIDDLPNDLPADTVLTGIIDTGIPLGHRRTRRRDGSTRILSAWQQTATFGGQLFLNFGQELYASQIDDAIMRNTVSNSLLGWLDEDAFNRDTRLVEPHLLDGHRDLDFRAAHGSHVLDLACGLDPASTSDEGLNRQRIIAVNLPPQALHGTAGNFLALWAILAMERIFHVAEATWHANKKAGNAVPEGGYPLVINFSYGMQAGPKDGTSHFEKAIEALLDARAATFKAPARIVMPVGNDNLERVNARAYVGTVGRWRKLNIQKTVDIPWRIMPEDLTPNYVEIWNSAMPEEHEKTGTKGKKLWPKDIELFIAPPGQALQKVPRLAPGEHSDFGNFARVYCRRDFEQLAFVLAVAPTMTHDNDRPIAPAGLWRLCIEGKVDIVNTNVQIQSDQAVLPGSLTGRTSYFDHARADVRPEDVYPEDGRPRDSYDYLTGDHTDTWVDYGPIQIKGTQNALATLGKINLVGGHRASDGKPALYSSSSDGNNKRNGIGREHLDATYPSEDAPSLFGILASGSRDGSVVAYRGTSMAAGLATRDIAAALEAWGPVMRVSKIGDSSWLQDRASAFLTDPDRPASYRQPHILKGGMGQIPDSSPRHVPRLGPIYE
jgi:hypothetical protein